MAAQSNTKTAERTLVEKTAPPADSATLTHAKVAEAAAHRAFLARNAHPLKIRTDEAVLLALEEQGLFLVNHNVTGALIGTATIFRHTRGENGWAELGQTSVEDAWQGYGLMRAMVPHAITQIVLADEPENPIFAITTKENHGSRKSLENCAFAVASRIPRGLTQILSADDLGAIKVGEKLLHLADNNTIASSFEYVADHREEIELKCKTEGKPSLLVKVAFPILRKPELSDELRRLAKLRREGRT